MNDEQLIKNVTVEQIDLFQEVAEWRLQTLGLKESVTVISNYVDTHLSEENPRIYDIDHERYMTGEQKRAVNAERELTDKLPHKKLRKYLSGHIACLDTLKAA